MQKKHALVVGVDHYSNLEEQYQLSGCVNDAKLVKRVLIDRFGFVGSEITELHNASAGRAGILGEMKRLVDEIDKDDSVFFHFSGHGSRRTSADPEEASGMDSTIMPSDSGRDPLPNLDIVDDEIHEWLRRLSTKTRSITLTFDCCHSGTITRAARRATVRTVEADTRSLAEMGVDVSQLPHKKKAQQRNVAPGGWLAISNAYVVMSGCRDDEYSYEFENQQGNDLVKNGALTYFLTNALTTAKPGETYRDVFERASQGVTAKFPEQHPQIVGADDRNIFDITGA